MARSEWAAARLPAMFLDRWRARRALVSRTPPTTVEDPAHPRLISAVRSLCDTVACPFSVGDPIWHQRWEGDLQLVALDARSRSVSDVRQRLTRTSHELALRHMAARGRRMLAVVLCEPEGGEGLTGFHSRLQDDRGEVGQDDWRRVSRKVSVLLLEVDGKHQLFGNDDAVADSVKRGLQS